MRTQPALKHEGERVPTKKSETEGEREKTEIENKKDNKRQQK